MRDQRGCHAYPKKTLLKIVKKGFDYIAQVKANQKELLEWVEFNTSVSDPIDTFESYDHNTHGRYEKRIYRVYDDLYQIDKSWPSIKRIVKVTSKTLSYAKFTTQTHYYISSLQVDAKTFAHAIRSHWRIENALHYVKDVSFDEDRSKIRTAQAPLVATILRSLAINFMRINQIDNIKKARKLFAWSPHKLFSLRSYLIEVKS